MMKRIESQDLKNLGMSAIALVIYADCDDNVYSEGNGLYTIKCRQDLVSEGNTINDLNAYFEQFAKEDFEEMIRDFITDHRPEYDNLEIEEVKINEETGEWEAIAQDEKCTYSLTDNGIGNIEINYLETC